MRLLHLAPNLKLPLDFATKTAAILAQRRKGKTYTASVIAEEMVAAKQPFVALDPTGAWWGLRAAADGKGAGLPVVVLGGQHVFTLKLFESEARELRQMSQASNRQPGEQLRAILQAAIRQWRKAPSWIPEELDR